MDDTLPWAAGVLEGEGCFTKNNRKYLRVRVQMTDEDVILRLRDFFKVGNLNGPYNWGKKDVYVWDVQKHGDARFIMESVLPYMGKRRSARIEELLSLFS